MAEFPDTFDPNEVEQDERDFPAIPAGDYLLQFIESSIEDFAWDNGASGKQVKTTIEVMEGPMQNRRLWENFNYRCTNAEWQRMGQQRLAQAALACGINGPLTDTDQLHYKPFIGTIGFQKKDPSRNAIKKFKPRNAAPATTGQSSQQTSKPTPNGGQAYSPSQTGQGTKPAQGDKPWKRAGAAA